MRFTFQKAIWHWWRNALKLIFIEKLFLSHLLALALFSASSPCEYEISNKKKIAFIVVVVVSYVKNTFIPFEMMITESEGERDVSNV
jgi:hypothetical protein